MQKKIIGKKGFTLIEIIVVLAILTVIVSFGTVVDFSSFTSSTIENEESKIISLLQKARSRAMNNMNQTTHGVCYISPDYVIFEGTTCTSGEPIPANVNIASNGATIFPAVIFNQLTGNTNSATDIIIHITDGVKERDITINNEGTINW